MGNTVSRWRNYAEITYDAVSRGIESSAREFKPGKPHALGRLSFDSITLSWERPTTCYSNFRYQIRYKVTNADQWEYHASRTKEGNITINDLQSKTKYVFQVRMINIDTEGPYSEPSDEIETLETAAARYLELTYALQESTDTPSIRRIPLDEISNARQETKKIRKFQIGSPNRTATSEKTIVLLGAKESDKCTFIDGIVNYCLGVKWTDNYRFTVRNSETTKNDDEWTTEYWVNALEGSRLNFKLKITDTQSFDADADNGTAILQQLKCLFESKPGDTKYYDAVCLLVRAQDTKLSKSHLDFARSVVSTMNAESGENVCVLATFADCKEPPVLKALGKAGILYDKCIPINNAALFEPNNTTTSCPLSPLFWKIGTECLSSFFNYLNPLSAKIAMPFVPDRHVLEDKIEDLQPQLVSGLDEIVHLKTEKKIVEDNKQEIELNATFTYTVKIQKLHKTDLSPGKHVTNCLNCTLTCHESCNIPRNEDKAGCWAMDESGNCRICFEKCHWTSHANTPYIYRYVEETITKTYTEKEDTYRKTPGETMTVTKVLDRMADHVKDLEKRIKEKMNEIRVHINLLRRVSNRNETMTLTDQIELLKKGEEKKNAPGWEERVKVLMDLLNV